jgi:two-component system chemotaxis response regulator CheY
MASFRNNRPGADEKAYGEGHPMSLSVLLASKCTDTVETFKRGLIIAGFRDVRIVKDPVDVEALPESGVTFDLAVVEIGKHHETDLVMLSTIRESFPGVECVVISASNDADLAMACVERGACDFMTIPFSKDAFVSRLKIAMMYKKPAGGRPRILIMEDDPVSAKLMKIYLDPYGDCTLVADGMEAVQVFERAVAEGGIYQLLILDIMVPEMHGKDVLRKVREIEEQYCVPKNRKCRIIMTTALSDTANVVESFKSKCDSYLVKPIDRKVLQQELAQLGFDTVSTDRALSICRQKVE